MRLADTYSINVRYQRATRIDNDLSADFFPGLVFHGTAENTLRTLGRQFAEGQQRAFTVTGPYGTGKSTIALLLTGFLHHKKVYRNAAQGCIRSKMSEELGKYFPVKKGWLVVRAVGGVESPIITIWKSVYTAVKDHPKTSKLAEQYAIPKEAPNEAQLEQMVINLLNDVKGKVDGVYFMLDEMGKVLEHFIKHDLNTQFFQNFAENFQKAELPAFFVGFLHQAFSEYAHSRGKAIQDEWAKIQGRYSDLLYNVSEDETVALIAQSIESKSQRSETWHSKLVSNVCSNLQRAKLRDSAVLHDRLQGCFPLHPTVALLLGPISKRRFSQNERSTFSFLNSREPHSFHNFMDENDDGSHASYRLYHLWDYLESNLEHHIVSTNDGHAWSVASEAIIRTSNHGSDIHRQLIKTIAILNLFGRTLGMYATDKAVKSAMDHVAAIELEQYFEELKQQSIITFRKHLSAWAVFEGSDFDLEGLLELQREKLQFDDSWTSVLEYQQFTIAKRHYHEKGTLRWLDQRIALTTDQVMSEKWKSKHGTFASFLLLANESSRDAGKLVEFSKTHQSCAVGVSNEIEPLKVAARELWALQLIAKDTPELQHDKIAAKEYEARYGNARKELDDAYDKAFNNSQWWFDGQTLSAGSLNVIASRIADKIYPFTPQIFNELINRQKPSGTSNSARRKLMERMISYSDEENLGLNDGFPPEKAIYLSCLKQTGLHAKQENGEFSFVIPSGISSKNLQHMLKATEKTINESTELVTLADIYSMWEAKPYGLTAGLCPVIALAYLMSRDEELAYYDKDSTARYVFIPEIDDEFVSKMMRAPKEVGVRYYKVSGVKHHYIHTFARVAAKKLDRDIPPQALNIARSLVTFVHQKLPAWVKNARLPDGPAKKFRDAVLKANDPYQLLLEDLYAVFDLDSAKSEKDSDQMLDNALNSAIEELRAMDEEMLNGYKKILRSELGELSENLVERCTKVREVAADYRLQAFAQRLSQCQNSNHKWLEGLISLVAAAPAKDWNDIVLARGREELFDYCQRFKRVETFIAAGSQQDEGRSKSIALVIGSGGQAEEYVRQVTISDQQSQEVTQLKSELVKVLKKHNADDLKALALQETLQDLLSPYEAPVCAKEGA
ncbi:hypothetical protein [Endozoicomonas sp. ISHI1]|uniref:hypothetical protein n=1 Tax=Endozoicomonas sp. ISHI1 TaxID=2825882 RepID=UPI00214870C5|nr:hypothetical protein [Endozoicomonas sp. ISHI1]